MSAMQISADGTVRIGWRKKLKKKGKHLIVDISACGKMPDHTELYKFLDKLVKLVKMTALTKPYIVEGAPYNPGITGFVIIETSHISIHTFENTKTIALDIYSCMPFNHDKVLQEIYTEYQTRKIKYKVYPR